MILRKAAELQERGGRTPGVEGLSLQAIQDIGREVGLDSRSIERAASLLSATPPRRWVELMDGPTTFQLEDSRQGTLPQERLRELADVIRRVMEHQGEVKDVLGALEWKTRSIDGRDTPHSRRLDSVSRPACITAVSRPIFA